MLASLVMLLIPDFHPERWYADGYHQWLDIVQHSVYYFCFTLALLWLFPSVRRFYPWFFIILLTATLLEVAQLWIPKRGFSFIDMGSNLLGITLAYCCWWAIKKLFRRSSVASGK